MGCRTLPMIRGTDRKLRIAGIRLERGNKILTSQTDDPLSNSGSIAKFRHYLSTETR